MCELFLLACVCISKDGLKGQLNAKIFICDPRCVVAFVDGLFKAE